MTFKAHLCSAFDTDTDEALCLYSVVILSEYVLEAYTSFYRSGKVMASMWSVPRNISKLSLKLPQKYHSIYHIYISN